MIMLYLFNTINLWSLINYKINLVFFLIFGDMEPLCEGKDLGEYEREGK